MKRLLFLSAVLLFALGSLGESAKCLNRPWTDPGWENPPSTDGDHPWGGDNVTTGGTTTSKSASGGRIVPSTGFGPIDLVFRLFLYKYVPRVPQGRIMHQADTAQPSVTSVTSTNSSSNSGSSTIAN